MTPEKLYAHIASSLKPPKAKAPKGEVGDLKMMAAKMLRAQFNTEEEFTTRYVEFMTNHALFKDAPPRVKALVESETRKSAREYWRLAENG